MSFPERIEKASVQSISSKYIDFSKDSDTQGTFNGRDVKKLSNTLGKVEITSTTLGKTIGTIDASKIKIPFFKYTSLKVNGQTINVRTSKLKELSKLYDKEISMHTEGSNKFNEDPNVKFFKKFGGKIDNAPDLNDDEKKEMNKKLDTFLGIAKDKYIKGEDKAKNEITRQLNEIGSYITSPQDLRANMSLYCKITINMLLNGTDTDPDKYAVFHTLVRDLQTLNQR